MAKVNEGAKMEEDEEQNRNSGAKKVVIQIPSYQEVIDSSQPKSQSLFKPSQTFSQAFSSIKNSKFYSPPPPPPPLAAGTQSISATNNENPSPNTPSGPAPSQSANFAPPSSQAAQSRNAILVSQRQKGNPLLKHIRNVKWVFADVICDYLLGQNSCALYLSLRYHLLHPDYLYYRIRELQKNFKLRVILCHVDVEDVVKPLLEVTKTALLHDCTLLCAWSLEECGRYLETIKMYENKPADLIQGQMDTDYLSRLTHALTSVRHVNKTDVVTLGSTFGSFANVMDASMEDLARCPGIGERKVKRLYDTFHEPFKRAVASHPAAPESSQKNTEPLSVNEVTGGGQEQQTGKRQKKEPQVTVKSALSVAFSKYANKFGKKTDNSQGEKAETSNSTSKSKADDEGTAH